MGIPLVGSHLLSVAARGAYKRIGGITTEHDSAPVSRAVK
jgi:hypothetical protein